MSEAKVLMVGPGRKVKGGISTVVNSYYELNLDKKVKLDYLSTMEDANKLKKLFVAMLSYIKFSRQVQKYDVVHVHMAAQASFYRKALFVKKAFRKNKKIIIHQHAADFDEFYFNQSTEKERKKIKEIFSFADKVIVLSEEWASFFGENVCDKSKIVVLYNGVIIPQYEKESYEDQNILFLGRLGVRKGTYDLLKAIPKVLARIPKAMFYLGGDGDIEQCESIIKEAHLERNVKLLGWVRNEEKEKYLKESSVFILPSYHEGMPMSVLEAMSYGLATISTNAGGIPQIIEDGVDGIRIEAGNIDAIAESLIRVLNSEDMKRKIGEAGRTKIKCKFNVEKNIQFLHELYLEL